MKNILDTPIGEIVAANFKTADVFTHFGIDFCCGGQKTLSEACAGSGYDASVVAQKLEELYNQEGVPSHDFNGWEIDFLADYIINTHHQYVKAAIPQILPLAKKVADVHGDHHPELARIKELFQSLADDMLSHMQKEEQILFPLIKQLYSQKKKGEAIMNPASGPIHVMMTEHDDAGLILKEISKLSNAYATPADACNTFLVCYSKLKEFENDLHRHIHLENNILFPKTLAL